MATEKGGLQWAAVMVIGLGVMVVTQAAGDIQCTFVWAIRAGFGIGLLLTGFVLLKLRELLKLNAWSDLEIVDDFAPLERFIHWIEGK